jgi:O-antigen/teichoic acid export membrane protein
MKSVQFFKSVAWLIILNLVVKPVWIFYIDRKVQLIVGNEAYGTYFALFNFTFILSFIADAGLSNLMNQRLATNPQLNIFQYVNVKLLLLISYCAVCITAGWIAGIDNWEIFIYLIFVNVLSSVFIFLRSIVSANQLFSVDAGLSVIDKIFMIVLCSAFIYGSFRKIDLVLFLRLQVMSTAISGFIATLIIFRNVKPRKRIGIIESRTLTGLIPFASVIFLMSLHYRLDGFLISKLNINGKYEAGVYAAAYRLLDAANMIGYLTASFMIPYIARVTIQKSVSILIIKIRNIILLLGLFAISFVIIYSPTVQLLLYHTSTTYISSIITLVLLSLPAYYLVHIYGSVFSAHSDFKSFISVLMVSVSINIIGNIILIPIYGAWGAAIVSIISQYTCGIALFYLASKKYSLESDFKSLIGISTYFILFILLFYIGKHTNIHLVVQILFLLIPVVFYIVNQINYFRKNIINA